jgi:hypothetical protein
VDGRGLPVVGDDVDGQEAAHAHHERRGILLLGAVGADQDVRGELVSVGLGDRREIRAPMLLFPVEDDLDLPLGGAGPDGVHGAEDVRKMLALVVGSSASHHAPGLRAPGRRSGAARPRARRGSRPARTARTGRPATSSAVTSPVGWTS